MPRPASPGVCVVCENKQLWGACWVQTETQVSISLGMGGKKCICHSVKIPYGSEEKLMREKGAVEGWMGRGSTKPHGDKHRGQGGLHLSK